MKYLIYILFLSVTAFAQQDSIKVTVQSIERRPNAAFLQTLQNQMPNLNIVSATYINTHKLTQADKDSIYEVAFNSEEVQLAIRNKFKYNGQLLAEGFEVEVLSVLLSREVSSEGKKQLLINRILADRKGERRQYVAATARTIVTDTIHSRELAVSNYIAAAQIDFSKCLYVINGIPYAAESIENYQSLCVALQETEVNSIHFMTGNEANEANMSGERPSHGIIIISGNN